MAIVKWRPSTREMRRWEPTSFEREIDDLFDRFRRFFGMPWPAGPIETRGWGPLVDIIDQKDEVLVKADLPGIKKEDIHVSVSDDTLTIEGETKTDEETKEEDYHCCERSYGKFYREVSLPSGVQKEKISSAYRDGVLEVHLPKSEEAKQKRLETKVE